MAPRATLRSASGGRPRLWSAVEWQADRRWIICSIIGLDLLVGVLVAGVWGSAVALPYKKCPSPESGEETYFGLRRDGGAGRRPFEVNEGGVPTLSARCERRGWMERNPVGGDLRRLWRETGKGEMSAPSFVLATNSPPEGILPKRKIRGAGIWAFERLDLVWV